MPCPTGPTRRGAPTSTSTRRCRGSTAQFLAYCLYRWEIILRESAIFGILGVTTLGFYVDAAISELRLDVAVVLILATAALSMAVDALSRALRRACGSSAGRGTRAVRRSARRRTGLRPARRDIDPVRPSPAQASPETRSSPGLGSTLRFDDSLTGSRPVRRDGGPPGPQAARRTPRDHQLHRRPDARHLPHRPSAPATPTAPAGAPCSRRPGSMASSWPSSASTC